MRGRPVGEGFLEREAWVDARIKVGATLEVHGDTGALRGIAGIAHCFITDGHGSDYAFHTLAAKTFFS